MPDRRRLCLDERYRLADQSLGAIGIYVERSANGQRLTNHDLDACHGRVSNVLWNRKTRRAFHYDATIEYPYTMVCFEGTKNPSDAIVP